MSTSGNYGIRLVRSGVKCLFTETWKTSRVTSCNSLHKPTIFQQSGLNVRAFSCFSSSNLEYHKRLGPAFTQSLLDRTPGGQGPSSGVRWSSRSSDDDTKTEIKGFFIHLPNPIEWVKDRVFTVFIRRFLDPSFNIDDFVFGAKQALSYLTRLMVMKDYETMKTVATTEVISKMKDLVGPWSDEQLQSIEILVTDISLASANITSVSSLSDSYQVNIDLFCVALRTYKQRPLLVQMVLRFSRCYQDEKETDWLIHRILEFNVREILKEERDRYQK